MSTTVTISGWTVGAVDGLSSVVAAKNEYNAKPSALTEAAYNAAVANAYAAETALIPVTGAFFASQAVTADIKDMQMNGSSPAKIITIIGNVATLFGQNVQLFGAESTPVSLGAGVATFALGEVVDAVGLLFTVAGASMDLTEISSYVQQSLAALGLTANANGNYTPLSNSNAAFAYDPVNGDGVFLNSPTAGSLSGSVTLNSQGFPGFQVSGSNLTANLTTAFTDDVSLNGPNNTIIESGLNLPTEVNSPTNNIVIGGTNSVVDLSNAVVTLAADGSATFTGTPNTIDVGLSSTLTLDQGGNIVLGAGGMTHFS